ncbi:MAG: DUF86 domain-containing protein [Nitrospira sp.]|nr:DUF86 domain-containing protein [Nitrospira sp.]
MIDKEFIRKKLTELENYILTLEDLKGYSLEELQKNRAKAWSVEHGLQLSIQLLIDTGNHILAVIGEQEIEDYVDIIDKLGERGIHTFRFYLFHKGNGRL